MECAIYDVVHENLLSLNLSYLYPSGDPIFQVI